MRKGCRWMKPLKELLNKQWQINKIGIVPGIVTTTVTMASRSPASFKGWSLLRVNAIHHARSSVLLWRVRLEP